MLNCHEITRLASEKQERPLTFGESMGFYMHTSMCAGCRNFNRQMGDLRKMMKAFANGADQGTARHGESKDSPDGR